MCMYIYTMYTLTCMMLCAYVLLPAFYLFIFAQLYATLLPYCFGLFSYSTRSNKPAAKKM